MFPNAFGAHSLNVTLRAPRTRRPERQRLAMPQFMVLSRESKFGRNRDTARRGTLCNHCASYVEASQAFVALFVQTAAVQNRFKVCLVLPAFAPLADG